MLSRLRAIILEAYPDLVEGIKWKELSKLEGVPVWVNNGNICMADTLKA